MRHSQSGFTLIELANVMTIMTILLGFGVPAFGRYMDDLALQGTAQRIASTLQMTRGGAVATNSSRTAVFEAGHSGTDYRVEMGGATSVGWTLPKQISYARLPGTVDAVTVTPDGRFNTSGLIILQNSEGLRDTVSVLSSGLVLTQ